MSKIIDINNKNAQEPKAKTSRNVYHYGDDFEPPFPPPTKATPKLEDLTPDGRGRILRGLVNIYSQLTKIERIVATGIHEDKILLTAEELACIVDSCLCEIHFILTSHRWTED